MPECRKMEILWLVSTTLPAAAAACGLAGAGDVSGGWLAGQLDALRGRLDLTVCSIDKRVTAPASGSGGGASFVLLPARDEAAFAALLDKVSPDLVHIWGTEYAAALALHRAAAAKGVPALVGIQGVMAACAAHLCDGVPPRYLKSNFLQRAVDHVVPGKLLDLTQREFDALAVSEATLLAESRYVTGRTSFDKNAVSGLAPEARYFPCNETLRDTFYTGPLWQPRTVGTAPVLLMSQGNYPLKNLHTALKALPTLLKTWPSLMLRVAGWPPLDKGPLFRPVIDRMFPYQTWCQALIDEFDLADHVEYTGALSAAAMRQAYLDADLFLLPSYCENSPNSLGEAMLLGLPCVVSRVGGIPDMAADDTEAVFYAPAGDEAALAGAATRVLQTPNDSAAMGQAARARALQTHNRAANARTMESIYRTILADNGPAVEGKVQ